MQINGYLANRVRQISSLSIIVPGSTPVVSFGDASRANVATLGLNPSRVEFLDAAGELLVGDKRRLANKHSLKLKRQNLSQASDEQVQHILDDCAGYYQRNPYRRWFNQLEPMLEAVGASYFNGTACHLDLVQSATDPTWRGLSPSNRKQLLSTDTLFLLQQLKYEQLAILLLNGRSVIQLFQRWCEVELHKIKTIDGDMHQPDLFIPRFFVRPMSSHAGRMLVRWRWSGPPPYPRLFV